MRTCLVISAIVHAAIALWLFLVQGAKPFDPAYADAIVVDLVQPQDDPSAAQSGPEPAKPEPSKSSSSDRKPAAGSEEDKAAAAARLAWLLDVPPAAEMPPAGEMSLAAPPSEIKASLPPDIMAKFKAQVRKCFVPPASPPDVTDFETLIRVALNRNGTLAADPEPVFAPGSANGPALVKAAIRAVRQCQPYGFLPADKYADWRVIDLVFSFDGPADNGNAVIQKIQSFMASH
jgi:hypothetical protein